MKKLEAMFIEMNSVLKAKGVDVSVTQLKDLMDYQDWDQESHMIAKMEYERELNFYSGISNAIKITVLNKQMQHDSEVA